MRSAGGIGTALVLVGAFIAATLTSCSPGYVMRGAYEQSKILLSRRDITDVVADPDTSSEDRDKLRLVVEARRYSASIGLKTGNSFTTYSDIGKDTLSWVVVGARKDSFSLYTWWFPVVGSVPYKGFFDKSDAEEQATALQQEGYETWVRGTDAFSTLGWFNDPVLSTTLKNSPMRIANTVIHESVHPTVWIKGNVPFNESLANFVAAVGTEQFFEQHLQECRAEPTRDCTDSETLLTSARRDAAVQYDLSTSVGQLYDALDTLYRDPAISSEQKIERRGVVFNQHVVPLRSKYPQLKALQEVNNAEIMQLKIYLTGLELFRALYDQEGRDWKRFFAAIEDIQAQRDSDEKLDPYVLLRNKVERNT